jgi:hypothetical protein
VIRRGSYASWSGGFNGGSRSTLVAIEEAGACAATALSALGGQGHDDAEALLRP